MEGEPGIDQIMQLKLDHADAILESHHGEDYETLEDSAGFRYAVMEIEAPAKDRKPRGRGARLRRYDVEVRALPCANAWEPNGRGIWPVIGAKRATRYASELRRRSRCFPVNL